MAKKKASKKKEMNLTHEELTEEIRKEAQKVFEKRVASRKQGDELSDWLEAEQVVHKKLGIKWYSKG